MAYAYPYAIHNGIERIDLFALMDYLAHMSQGRRSKRKTSKILVSVWTVLHDALNRRVEASCLRRDAFLDQVISSELPRLREEIRKANSNEARRYIEGQFNLLPRKSLTLALRSDTVKLLDEICEQKNIVRDVFLNRLFLCLLAPRKLLDVVFSTDEDRDEAMNQIGEPYAEDHWQMLRMIPDMIANPFWFIRACLSVGNERSGADPVTFYEAYFPENLFGDPNKTLAAGEQRAPNTLGLNVYLADELIPGSQASKSVLAALDIELGGPKRT